MATTPDGVALEEGVDEVDLELPAEEFIRLVYGRLDPDNTQGAPEGDVVGRLRTLFPGI